VLKSLVFALLTLLYVFSLLIMSTSSLPSAEKLYVSFYDVGQGDAIEVAYKNLRFLVDGGGDNTVDLYSVKNILLGCSYDLIFLTHAHADHYYGLRKILTHCNTKLFMFNDVSVSSTSFERIQEYIKENMIFNPTKNTLISMDELNIIVLWPPSGFPQPENLNNMSTVLLIDLGDFEMLLTGDAEVEVWQEIDRDLLATYIDGGLEVYKAPHHGASNGLYKELLPLLNPQNCVISVGKGNSFGHPSQETLDFYDSIGCRIWRTDIHGNIVFTTKTL
jgi:competence protein ComEC